MPDHDQFFKALLMEFPQAFFDLFFPDWAARFDFSRIEWLQQEVFPDPPDGERRAVDLVAKLPVRPIPGEPDPPGGSREWLALIHMEFESGDSIGAFRPRLLWYHINLRQRHRLPVLPVAMFQGVGLEGLGEDEYVESFGPLEVIRFRYLYVGFPRLKAEEWLTRENPLAPGLVALMKVPADRQAEIKAQAIRRISQENTTPQQKHLLFCCLERYLVLSESEEREFGRMMQESEFSEAEAMAVTTYEKGIEAGIEKGIEKGREDSLRQMVLRQLQARFAPLPAAVKEEVQRRSVAELDAMVEKLVTAQSLEELGF